MLCVVIDDVWWFCDLDMWKFCGVCEECIGVDLDVWVDDVIEIFVFW